MSSTPTRRQFLATASTGAALALSATSYARVVGANERISIGLVGCGGRGYGAHMTGVHKHDKEQNVEFTAVSDPWRLRRERAAARCQQWYGRPARQFVSYRDIVALDDVDAVMIASCDHHHATHLEAVARAKKDAYCEKPLAMDMESLKQCCDAVKESGIVVQMGTQVRSYPTSTGCRELFRSGVIGKVSRIEQCRNGSKPYWYSWMERAEEIKEKDVDWKEFLMDRPMRPFDGKLLTGWYGYREFSDGPLANLGCHFYDLYNYITGSTLPTSAVAQGGTFTWKDEYGFTCPDHCQAVWQRQRAQDLRRPGDDGPDPMANADLFPCRRDQAQRGPQARHASPARGNCRPLPQLAGVSAFAQDHQRAHRGRLPALRAVPDGHAGDGYRPSPNIRPRETRNPRGEVKGSGVFILGR